MGKNNLFLDKLQVKIIILIICLFLVPINNASQIGDEFADNTPIVDIIHFNNNDEAINIARFNLIESLYNNQVNLKDLLLDNINEFEEYLHSINKYHLIVIIGHANETGLNINGKIQNWIIIANFLKNFKSIFPILILACYSDNSATRNLNNFRGFTGEIDSNAAWNIALVNILFSFPTKLDLNQLKSIQQRSYNQALLSQQKMDYPLSTEPSIDDYYYKIFSTDVEEIFWFNTDVAIYVSWGYTVILTHYPNQCLRDELQGVHANGKVVKGYYLIGSDCILPVGAKYKNLAPEQDPRIYFETEVQSSKDKVDQAYHENHDGQWVLDQLILLIGIVAAIVIVIIAAIVIVYLGWEIATAIAALEFGKEIALGIILAGFLIAVDIFGTQQSVEYSGQNTDTDNDGWNSYVEQQMGTSDNNPDTDGDGIIDSQEYQYGTSPTNPDTDGDGYLDGFEVNTFLVTNNPQTDPDYPTSYFQWRNYQYVDYIFTASFYRHYVDAIEVLAKPHTSSTWSSIGFWNGVSLPSGWSYSSVSGMPLINLNWNFNSWGSPYQIDIKINWYWHSIIYMSNAKTFTNQASSPPGGGGGCVADDTNILLANGSTLQAQNLNIGVWVLGYDITLGTSIPIQVTELKVSTENTLLSINNGFLKVTLTDQPIWIRNNDFLGWVRDPKNLKIGDEMFDVIHDSWVKITSLDYIHKHTGAGFSVYDIKTSPLNVFIANGILLDMKVQ